MKIPNLKKLQDVIPITYQKTLHNVTVTIPSLEIFDTGFKFHVYTKGEFDKSDIIPNGHTPIVVSLHDDSGNIYIPTERGGGGSQYPLGFDYKHEFHGKPICSDVKQLAITLREIIIQERFSKPNMNIRTKNIIRGIKEEYEQIDKFPSFCIIPGPWKVTFSLKH